MVTGECICISLQKKKKKKDKLKDILVSLIICFPGSRTFLVLTVIFRFFTFNGTPQGQFGANIYKVIDRN